MAKDNNVASKAMKAYDEIMYPDVPETPLEFMFSSMFVPITRREYNALLALRRVIMENLPKNDVKGNK